MRSYRLVVFATVAILGLVATSRILLAEDAAPRAITLEDVVTGRAKIVDLTYPLNKQNAYWPGDNYEPFQLHNLATLEKNGVLSKAFSSPEHLGTHIDAPNHFAKDQIAVDQIKPADLFAPGVVIDVASPASQDADFLLTAEHVKAWEAKHGEIPSGAVVLLNTGWGRHWGDTVRYQNKDVHGQMHFPGFGVDAVKLLLDHRKVRGIGIDTMSIDYGLSRDFAVHKLLNGAGRYGLENVAHLDDLPPRDFYLSIAPMKIETGSGGPTRIFALLASTDDQAASRDFVPPPQLAEYFQPPEQFRGDFGNFHSPLEFSDGSRAQSPTDWQKRRSEILSTWHEAMGPWPPLIESPRVEVVETTKREGITQIQMRIEIALDGEMVDAFLLVPAGEGPFPAVLVAYYDAQTGVGFGKEHRDFAWQLARRGFVTLSIGKPNATVDLKNPGSNWGSQYIGPLGTPVRVEPLSALAYAAANAHTVLARRPEVRPDRIGIVGHSFGGKWAMMAACLYDKFAYAAWSDPGIVFDERDRREENPGGTVNYWDVWYLGFELGQAADVATIGPFRKLPSEGQPRTGAYKKLVESQHDLVELHALMAPRPFLVSGGTADMPERWPALNHAIAVNRVLGCENRVAMTNRTTHDPTADSNEQIYQFFAWWLRAGVPIHPR